MSTENTTDPVIAVVVVNWNGAHLLSACLDALLAQNLGAEHYEIWVVDNASRDESLALLAERYPQVRVLRNERNEGFAGGCNTALRLLNTPFAVLVNNDAVADPEFLAALLNRASTPGAERVAAITAKVLLASRFVPTTESKPVEGALSGIITVENRTLRPMTTGDSEHNAVDVINSTGNEIRADGYGQDRGWLTLDGVPTSTDVFGFCGAAALLRMDAVRAAGYFDDRFFLYYEDTDLSWRLQLLGYAIEYEPAAVVRHEHAASTGEGSAVHRFYGDRNRLLCLARCAPESVWLAASARFVLTTLSGLRREPPPWRRTTGRLRALASFVRLLPETLWSRWTLRRRLVRSRREVFGRAVAATSPRTYRGSGP